MTTHGGEQIEQTAQGGQGGYAPINGLNLYYEIHGSGRPLLLLHGGFGLTGMFGEVLPRLAAGRRVIAVDLQGHGRTADLDRPLRFELMAEDIAALITYLQLSQTDVMGYSLGGAEVRYTAARGVKSEREAVRPVCGRAARESRQGSSPTAALPLQSLWTPGHRTLKVGVQRLSIP